MGFFIKHLLKFRVIHTFYLIPIVPGFLGVETSKLWKSMAKLPCPESNCPSHHQVASETVRGANLALRQVKCDACIEQNEVCKCDNGGINGLVKTEDIDQQAGANSSFLHAVLNMSGMLIGN